MIEIIYAEKIEEEESASLWVCWLEISQGGQMWMLPATAPGNLSREGLQAHFDERKNKLWKVAKKKQYASSAYKRVEPESVLEACMLVMLEEINFLRTDPGRHDPITEEDLETAIKKKLKGF